MLELKFLVYLNAGILGSIIIIGYRIVRFFNRMEFKMDLLWKDYENRTRDFG
jgi:hypothetical protein